MQQTLKTLSLLNFYFAINNLPQPLQNSIDGTEFVGLQILSLTEVS